MPESLVTLDPEYASYLPVGLLDANCIVQEKAFALYDAPLWNMALIASRVHWVWIGTVCVRMRIRLFLSNLRLVGILFPVPKLTDKNKEDLTRSCLRAFSLPVRLITQQLLLI
jgi:hypothetical protein